MMINAIVHTHDCSVCSKLVESIRASLRSREVRPGTPLPCAFPSPASEEKEGIEEALEDACQDLFDHVMLDTEPRGSKEEWLRMRRTPGTMGYEEAAATMIPRYERSLISASGVVVKCMYDEETDNIYTTTTAANDNNRGGKAVELRECTALAMPMMQMTLSKCISHLKDKKNGLHVWDKEVDGAIRLAIFRALYAKLEGLHKCGNVVHGDIKGDNVMFGLGRYGQWIDEVDTLTELMHEKLERRKKEKEEEEVEDEEDLLGTWTEKLKEIFEESMRLVDFGLSQEIKDAPTAAQEEERRKVMEERRLAKRRKRDSLKVEAVRLTVDDEDKWRSLTTGPGAEPLNDSADVEWLMARSGVNKQRLHAVRVDLRRKEVEAKQRRRRIEASHGMPMLVSITSLGIEPSVAQKVTRMRRGKEGGGKGNSDGGGGCVAERGTYGAVLLAPSEVGPSMAFKVSHAQRRRSDEDDGSFTDSSDEEWEEVWDDEETFGGTSPFRFSCDPLGNKHPGISDVYYRRTMLVAKQAGDACVKGIEKPELAYRRLAQMRALRAVKPYMDWIGLVSTGLELVGIDMAGRRYWDRLAKAYMNAYDGQWQDEWLKVVRDLLRQERLAGKATKTMSKQREVLCREVEAVAERVARDHAARVKCLAKREELEAAKVARRGEKRSFDDAAAAATTNSSCSLGCSAC
tara:strand:- start:4359 stop:6419 length:2061 start_codon:yes stop_codon:yes gene_type:complete